MDIRKVLAVAVCVAVVLGVLLLGASRGYIPGLGVAPPNSLDWPARTDDADLTPGSVHAATFADVDAHPADPPTPPEPPLPDESQAGASGEGQQGAAVHEAASRGPGSEESPADLQVSDGPSVEIDISGWVFDEDGQPIGDVRIFVRVVGPVQLGTDSASDGSFRIRDTVSERFPPFVSPTAIVRVSAEPLGYCSEQKTDVPLDAKDVTFVLRPLGYIQGFVIDAVTEEPLTNFEARIGKIWQDIQPVTLPDVIGWEHFANASGAFRLAHDFTGIRSAGRVERIALEVRAPGYLMGETDFFNATQDESAEGIVIRLHPGDDITGVVLDGATGRPVEGARVGIAKGAIHARQLEYMERYGQTMYTGPDGRFALPAEEGGAVTHVMAFHPAYSPGFANDIEFSERHGVTIYLKKGGVLLGRVTNRGQPARHFAIWPKMTLAYPMLTFVNNGETDLAGEYRVDGLPEGMYAVRFLGPDGITYGKVLAEIASGMETRLNVELTDFAQLVGWIVGVEDHRNTEFFMADAQLPEEILYNSTTDDEGYFEYGRVLPGDYLVTIVHNGPPVRRYRNIVALGRGERPAITVDFSAIAPD